MKIKWQTIAPLGIWLVIYLLPVPAGLNANQWHYFAVFAAVIAGLVLESMPVGAVGLIGLTFAGVMGYVESDPGKSLRWMLSGFSESKDGADRRRVRVLDRLSQERAGQENSAAAGSRPGPTYDWLGLCRRFRGRHLGR
jgi:sodium:sulfate symporter-like transmembrane protein